MREGRQGVTFELGMCFQCVEVWSLGGYEGESMSELVKEDGVPECIPQLPGVELALGSLVDSAVCQSSLLSCSAWRHWCSLPSSLSPT